MLGTLSLALYWIALLLAEGQTVIHLNHGTDAQNNPPHILTNSTDYMPFYLTVLPGDNV